MVVISTLQQRRVPLPHSGSLCASLLLGQPARARQRRAVPLSKCLRRAKGTQSAGGGVLGRRQHDVRLSAVAPAPAIFQLLNSSTGSQLQPHEQALDSSSSARPAAPVRRPTPYRSPPAEVSRQATAPAPAPPPARRPARGTARRRVLADLPQDAGVLLAGRAPAKLPPDLGNPMSREALLARALAALPAGADYGTVLEGQTLSGPGITRWAPHPMRPPELCPAVSTAHISLPAGHRAGCFPA